MARNRLTLFRRTGCVAVIALLAAAVSAMAAAASEPGNELALREAQIRQMSVADRDRLLRQSEKLASLSSQQRSDLRTLSSGIEQDSESHELRRVARNYYRWLKTLLPSQRAELAALAPEKRFERVREMREKEKTRADYRSERRLSDDDLSKFGQWVVAEWIADFPPDRRRHLQRRMQGFDRPEGLRHLMMLSAVLRSDRGGRPSPRSLQRLRNQLSDDARNIIQTADGERERWKILALWKTQLRERSAKVVRERMPDIDDEELAKVFETLPAQERERLLDLPPEEIEQALRSRYYGARQRGPSDRRGRGPGASRPPGERRRNSPPARDGGPPPRRPGRRAPPL